MSILIAYFIAEKVVFLFQGIDSIKPPGWTSKDAEDNNGCPFKNGRSPEGNGKDAY